VGRLQEVGHEERVAPHTRKCDRSLTLRASTQFGTDTLTCRPFSERVRLKWLTSYLHFLGMPGSFHVCSAGYPFGPTSYDKS